MKIKFRVGPLDARLRIGIPRGENTPKRFFVHLRKRNPIDCRQVRLWGVAFRWWWRC